MTWLLRKLAHGLVWTALLLCAPGLLLCCVADLVDQIADRIERA